MTSIAKFISTIAPSPSCSPSPIPYIPFEDPVWFSDSSSVGYAVVSSASFLTVLYFIYFVINVEYRSKKSIQKCLSSFNILLFLMFLSLTIWSVANLCATALYMSNATWAYTYYLNQELSFVALGNFGACGFRAAYLAYGWLRSKTLVKFHSKYFILLQYFMVYFVPLVICSPLVPSLYFASLNYQAERDPSFNSYYESYNLNTGSYESTLASSNVLNLNDQMQYVQNANQTLSAVVMCFCLTVDAYLISVFVTFVAKFKRVTETRNVKTYYIAKFGLSSSLTMLLATIIQCIRSYDNDPWNNGELNIWLNVIIIALLYFTGVLMLLMKFAVHKYENSSAAEKKSNEKGSK